MSAANRFPIPETTKAAQRRAANPRASSWASANAGSGKTFVLTMRVARLLLDGADPASILCLTFTKAAAAEMTNRLFGLLGRWSTLPDDALIAELQGIGSGEIASGDLPRARRLFARALETPGGLKIQTIHAFCQSLLGRFSLEAGISPHFSVLDDNQAAEFMIRARDSVLDRIHRGEDDALVEAWTVVVERIDEVSFEGLLWEIAGKRVGLNDMFGRHGGLEGVLNEVCLRLGVLRGESEEAMLRRELSDGILPKQKLLQAVQALRNGSKTDIGRGDTLAALLNATDRPKQFETYKSVFLTKDGSPKKTIITKQAEKADPAAPSIMREEQDRIEQLEQKRLAARMATATSGLLTFAHAFLAAFERSKLDHAMLDYDDLIIRTRNLLQDEGVGDWVLYKLDGGIDHILIDEAQDTNPEQWDVIRLLADEFFTGISAAETKGRVRTVFAVGDEKQSIYSFQGAEPAEFGRMRDYFSKKVTAAGKAWDPVDLTLSFRSCPDILDAVDTVFAHGTAAKGLTFGDQAIRHEALRLGDSGLVELWPIVSVEQARDVDPWEAPLDRIDPGSPAALLARRIAETISGWLTTGEALPVHGRCVEPGDILILVRRRNKFVDELVRRLKEHKVPVAGADRLVLTDHIAVMDLIALGQFAVLPEDELTLATVLKSPLLNHGEDDLMRLALGRSGSLWRAVCASDHPLDQEAAAFLHAVLERAGALAPFDFYSWLLREKAGRARLIGRLGPDAIDVIDEFLNLAQSFERDAAPTLQGFLQWVQSGQAQIKRDMEQAGGQVRIMTVHGSKGLEAKIVFLPDTCTRPDGKHDDKILTDSGGLALWPVRKAEDPPLASQARETLAARRSEEYRRLLYVAMTRAEDRLYICGYQSGKTPPADDCWYNLAAKALMPVAREIETPDGERPWRIGAEPGSADLPDQIAPSEPSEKAAVRTPDWLDRPAPPSRPVARVLAPSSLSTELDPTSTLQLPALSPLRRDDDKRFERGRVVHKLLQVLPDLAAETRREAALTLLGQTVHGYDAEEAEALIDEVFKVLDHPEHKILFGPQSRAEVRVAGAITELGSDTVIEGQIDRLAVTNDKVVLVDYKTNRPSPLSMKAIPPAYVIQMAAYCALVRRLWPGKAVSAYLLWTDGPRLMSLPAATLDKALRDLPEQPQGAARP